MIHSGVNAIQLIHTASGKRRCNVPINMPARRRRMMIRA